jgi:hypothetical protein
MWVMTLHSRTEKHASATTTPFHRAPPVDTTTSHVNVITINYAGRLAVMSAFQVLKCASRRTPMPASEQAPSLRLRLASRTPLTSPGVAMPDKARHAEWQEGKLFDKRR